MPLERAVLLCSAVTALAMPLERAVLLRYGSILNASSSDEAWAKHAPWLDKRMRKRHRRRGRHTDQQHERHRSYVGPTGRYGDMAASMFSLLYFSGLREDSRLLDVGCGSLRLGRLAIPFLARGNYHCIEPSLAALSSGVRYELGTDLLQLKLPTFATNSEFVPPEGEDAVDSYDYLMAQSVLSHAAEDLLEAALSRLRRKLSPRSVLLATFVVHTASTHLPRPEHPADEEKGWVYPACTSIERTRLARLVVIDEASYLEQSFDGETDSLLGEASLNASPNLSFAASPSFTPASRTGLGRRPMRERGNPTARQL